MTDTKKICKWMMISFLLLMVMISPFRNWFFGVLLLTALIMTVKYILV